MATKISIWDIKQEICIALRNADILSVGMRGVTTQQDTGTYSSDSTDTLNTDPTLVKNVRDITVGGSGLAFGTDYTVNYSTGVISYTSAQTGNFIINYDTGSTDRIFPDFPQPFIRLNQFPRLGFDINGGTTREVELGGGSNFTDYPISIVAYDTSQSNVETLISNIREFLIDNKKSFYYFDFMTPTIMGPMIPSPFGKDKIIQRNQDAMIRFVYED